jgi:hypothetical protein
MFLTEFRPILLYGLKINPKSTNSIYKNSRMLQKPSF